MLALHSKTEFRLGRVAISLTTAPHDGQRLTEECSRLFHRKLRTLISAVLEQAHQECADLLITAPLILDLGELPQIGFENAFCQRLEQLLLQRLLSYGQSLKLSTTSFDENTTVQAREKPDLVTQNTEQANQPDFQKQLSHYLRHGYWPASEPLPTPNSLDTSLIAELATEPERFLPDLANHCLYLSNRLRLYRSLQPTTLTRLCLYLANLQSITEPVTQGALQLCALRYFQLRPQCAMPMLQQDEPVCVLDGNELLLVMLFSDYDSASVALTTRLQKLWQQSAVRRVLELHLTASAYQRLQSRLDLSVSSVVPSMGHTRDTGSSNGNRSINHIGIVESKPISVNNGGITLLWPLLPGLFEQLGLMEKSKFIHSQAQIDAVCWLDELIWGDGKYAEWRMPLNKLLCGLPLDAPLEWTQPDAHALEVMQHWLLKLPERLPAWKHFGISDIRQLYLQRPAWLVPSHGDFTLYIEPQVYDVLLTDWPWPTGMLMLPWLIKPLIIHWSAPPVE